MQKTKVLALSGLALCAMVLAGCGQTNTPAASSTAASSNAAASSAASSSVNDVAATTLSITGVPAVSVEGDVIDLEKYVTVAPQGVSWTVKADTDNIVVDGHKITCTDPGDWSASVTAGSNKKVRKAKGTIVSSEVKAIRDFIADADLNYSSTFIKTGTTPTVLNKTIHTTKYVGEYPDGGTTGDGYIALSDNNVYEYSIAAGVVTAKSGVASTYADFHDAFYPTMALPIAAADIIDEVDAEGINTGNAVILPAVDSYSVSNMKKICFTLGYSLYYDNASAPFSNITKLVLSFDADKQVLTLTPYTASGATAYAYTLSDIGTTKVQALDDYSASGAIPAPAYITEAKTVLDAVPSKKNYSISAAAYWTNYSTHKYVAATTAIGSTTLGAIAPEAAVSGVVDTNGAYFEDETNDTTENGTSPVVTSYQKKTGDTSGKFYKVVSDTTKGTDGTITVTADKYTATATEVTDIFASANASGLSLGTLTTTMTENARYSETGTTTSGDTYYVLDYVQDKGALEDAILEAFPLNGNLVKVMADNTWTDGYAGLAQYFTYEMVVTSTSVDFLTFVYQITPDKTTYYQYVVDITVSDIGSSTLKSVDETKITWPTVA